MEKEMTFPEAKEVATRYINSELNASAEREQRLHAFRILEAALNKVSGGEELISTAAKRLADVNKQVAEADARLVAVTGQVNGKIAEVSKLDKQITAKTTELQGLDPKLEAARRIIAQGAETKKLLSQLKG